MPCAAAGMRAPANSRGISSPATRISRPTAACGPSTQARAPPPARVQSSVKIDLAEIDLRFEIGARIRARQRFLQFDTALAHEVVKRAVEAQHAALGSRANCFLDGAHIA